MNRRNFLAASCGLTLSALVPTWFPRVRHRVNLEAFCCKVGESNRYDMVSPFVQAAQDGERAFRFGTNGKIAVRVPDDLAAIEETVKKLPPANRLPYWKLEGAWHPWPEKYHQLAGDTLCQHCNKWGMEIDAGECPMCEGSGSCWCVSNNEYNGYPSDCPTCKSMGRLGTICTVCKGAGVGVFPALQHVGWVFVESVLDQKIRDNLGEVEYCVVPSVHNPFNPGIKFAEGPLKIRFAGGDGLVMPVDPTRAAERMRNR